MAVYHYRTNSEDPSIPIRWAAGDGTAVDLSAATFTLRLVDPDGTLILTKTSGITGYATFQGTAPDDYNARITWASGNLNQTPGTYLVELDAVVGGRHRPFPGEIILEISAVPA